MLPDAVLPVPASLMTLLAVFSPLFTKIAATAAFSQVTVTRYGKTEIIAVHAFTCLWYSVTCPAPVTVILI